MNSLTAITSNFSRRRYGYGQGAAFNSWPLWSANTSRTRLPDARVSAYLLAVAGGGAEQSAVLFLSTD